jgi:hypothetical protein
VAAFLASVMGAVILNRRAGRRARAFLVAFDAKRTNRRLGPEVLRR